MILGLSFSHTQVATIYKNFPSLDEVVQSQNASLDGLPCEKSVPWSCFYFLNQLGRKIHLLWLILTKMIIIRFHQENDLLPVDRPLHNNNSISKRFIYAGILDHLSFSSAQPTGPHYCLALSHNPFRWHPCQVQLCKHKAPLSIQSSLQNLTLSQAPRCT